jgi:hypothetical protein
MNEPSPKPAFEARPLKSARGWYVRFAPSDGKRDHIPGFVTQQEAQRWIEEWLSERCGTSAVFGRLAS